MSLICACAAIYAAGQQSYSTTAAGLLQSAGPTDAKNPYGVTLLSDETNITIDATNRVNTHYHIIYRIDAQDAVESWGSIWIHWSPWYQKKPVVRARVVTPDGTQHELDAKVLTDAAASNNRPETFDNDRVLSGPLPAVQVGSVVEEEDDLEDTQSFFPAGIVQRFLFGRGVPVQQRRVTVEYPASLPLRYRVVSGQGIATNKEEHEGRVRLVFEQSSLPAFDRSEHNLPPDVPAIPYVVVSTAPSWNAVAQAYNDVVEKQLASANLKDIAAKQAGANRMQTIENLLAYLHANVRYTGVEFDEATLVPRTPSETLSRKFGDCKDKATVLVALLRAAGIPADLALLDSGPGMDIDNDQPGMGDFDHAIVYVPGSPDLWIDATAEYHQAGTLPYMDQGRMALIVKANTAELRKTAEFKSAENLLVEHRDFELSPQGKAKVRETTEGFGDIDAAYRAGYGAGESKEDRQSLEEYAKNEYLGEALTKYEHGNGSDLRKPFHIVLEVARAKRGYTDPDDAVVAIRFESLFNRFPEYLKQSPDEKEHEGSIVDREKPRTVDVVFEPFVTEWRYHITLPAGFRVRTLPPSKTQPVGPAVLTYSFQQEKDGAVTGVVRLDSVKGRYTPAEAKDVQNAYKSLTTGDPLLLNFEETGAAELAAGHVREGLAAERKLVAQNPNDAAARSHLARALLDAGLGDMARDEARKATALDAKSALAYRALAWILEHDLIGRYLKKGFDRSGAVAAYRKAIELDPSNIETHVNLAVLLEHDASGRRYSPEAQLDDAISEYREVSKIDEQRGHAYDDSLLVDLLYARHFKEARDMAAGLPQTQQRLAVALASIAALDGSSAAISQSMNLARDSDIRRPALKMAGLTLRDLRMYALSADLLASVADGEADAAQILGQAQMFRGTKKYEEVIDTKSPVSAVQRMFLGLMVPSFVTKQMTDNEMEFVVSAPRKYRFEAIVRSGGAPRALFARGGVPLVVGADLIISNLKPSIEGDDAAGYRIRVQTLGAKTITAFVGRTPAGYKLFGVDRNVTGVGVEALRRLEAGDVAGAKRWIDWAREEITVPGGDDPIAWPAFPRLYERGEASDAGKLRRAALSLIADTDYSKPYLAEIRKLAEEAPEADRVTMQTVLTYALQANEQWKELQVVAASLFGTYPQSDFAFNALTTACLHTKDWAAWDSAINTRLKRLPDDARAVRSRVGLLESKGEFAQARAAEKTLLDSGRATPSDMNNYGWDALFTGKIDPTDLEVVQRASSMTENNSYAIVHTLACLYAEVGRTKEARELLLHTIDLGGLDEPDSEVWYVLGRIAEQYGEPEAAMRAYAHVETQPGEQDFPTSTWVLAQKRKEALESVGEKVPAAK